MPLVQSVSKEALKKNIGKEIGAGKDPKQAAAIAYSVQRKNKSDDCQGELVSLLTQLCVILQKISGEVK